MNMKNKCNQLGLAVVIAAIVFCFTACGGVGGGNGDGDGGNGTPEYGGGTPDGQTPGGQTPGGGSGLGPNNEVPGDTLAAQLEWLQKNMQSDKNYTLTARADEAVNGYLGYGNDKSNITVTLKSSGGEKIISSSSANSSILSVGSGVTLIVDENITFSNNRSCITLYGALVMNDGAKIISISDYNTDGCVWLYEGSTFTMNGGTISGTISRDGIKNVGVNMCRNGATFTMNGGEITGYSRALYMQYGLQNLSFTMNGGKISGNGKADINDCYGVDIWSGYFTMNGGEISGNTGGGVGMHFGASFTMNDGTISNNTYSGVQMSNGTFTMNGGTISGNICEYHGGGVYVSGETFTMNGGEISGNTAVHGGGVYVVSGTFTMNGGEISGNTATQHGGGVSVFGGYFRISNGIIYGSDAGTGKANTAPIYSTNGINTYNGASLCNTSGTDRAQYGIGDTWKNIPLIDSNNTIREATINVVNGVLQ